VKWLADPYLAGLETLGVVLGGLVAALALLDPR
jgi:hypothetical protein